MKNIIFQIVFSFFVFSSRGQELYPSAEPASTLPKKLVSARVSYQHYQEPLGRSKNWAALRMMYGATPTLTIIGTISISNHHVRTFPGNLFDYFRNHHKRLYPAFPYLAEGFHIYAKQRIFSRDGPGKHFRVAIFAEASKVFTVHDNAEPNLIGDNSGVGGGIIITKLMNRFAISLTAGYVHPFRYKDSVVTFLSGDAGTIGLSAGYRIYPKVYSGYGDLNVNFYVEFIARKYGAAEITYRNAVFKNSSFLPDDPYTYQTLIRNKYVEMRPAIQFIVGSSTRIDIGAAFQLYEKSYLFYYPQMFINLQKYFYSKK